MINIERVDYCFLCGNKTSGIGNICSACKGAAFFIKNNICSTCGAPLTSEKGECLRCRSVSFAFRSNRSLFEYKDVSKEIFFQYKFKKNMRIGDWYAFLLSCIIKKEYQNHLIVASPCSMEKKKKKGWDQVEHIVKILNKRYSIKSENVLCKTGTIDQKKLNMVERRKNIKGKISISRNSCIFKTEYLLIDDVFTTGATADECSRLLLSGGAENVSILTIAID